MPALEEAHIRPHTRVPSLDLSRRFTREWLARAWSRSLIALLLLAAPLRAEQVQIPARLQAALVAKVAAYDTHFAARANGEALVLIVVAGGKAESERFGEEIRAELSVQPKIGGVSHSEEIVRFSSGSELARLCKERHAALIYVAPSLSQEVPQIAAALTGLDVLSVAALAGDVQQRLVLGFARESGRPKLLVHLDQARRQNVAFNPDLLRLVRVIQ
ncbi:MAG: YfiR family protein [Deltaproteobacteria bacterium]